MLFNMALLKEFIIANPGATTKDLESRFDLSYGIACNWITKLRNFKEENGSGPWLFTQQNLGNNNYFSSVYAKENNIPLKILAVKKKYHAGSKNGVKQIKQQNDSCRLSKMWAAPKRVQE